MVIFIMEIGYNQKNEVTVSMLKNKWFLYKKS